MEAIAGHVGPGAAVLDEQRVAVVGPAVVLKRLIVGPAAVDAVEVEARRPEVDEPLWIIPALQLARRIERDVVIDKLSEVDEPCWDALVVSPFAWRTSSAPHRRRRRFASGSVEPRWTPECVLGRRRRTRRSSSSCAGERGAAAGQ